MATKIQLRKEFFAYHDELAELLQKSPQYIERIMDVSEHLDTVYQDLQKWYSKKIDDLEVYSEGEHIAKLRLELSVLDRMYREVNQKSNQSLTEYTQGMHTIVPSMYTSHMESTILDKKEEKPNYSEDSEKDKPTSSGSNFPPVPKSKKPPKDSDDEREMEEFVDRVADSVHKKLSLSLAEYLPKKNKEGDSEDRHFRPELVSTPAKHGRVEDQPERYTHERDKHKDWHHDYGPRRSAYGMAHHMEGNTDFPKLSISDRFHGLGYLQEDYDPRRERRTSHTEEATSDGIWNKYIQKVQMPTFDGKSDFDSWWSAFEAIIDRGPEPDVVKILHLKASLKGEAADCVKGLPHTREAYMKAKDRLYDQYGGVYKATARVYEEVKAFPQVTNPKDYQGMMKLLNVTDQTVSKLIQINRKWEIGSGFLTSQLISKLPFDVVYKYNDWRFEKSVPETMYSLIEFLERYISRCQVAHDLVHGSQKENKDKKSKSSRTMMVDGSNKISEGKGATGSGPAGSSDDAQKRKLKCKYCKGPHCVWGCADFKNLQVKERWEFVNKNHICFKCMSPKHIARECRNERTCGLEGCKLKHHRLLHEKYSRTLLTSGAGQSGMIPREGTDNKSNTQSSEAMSSQTHSQSSVGDSTLMDSSQSSQNETMVKQNVTMMTTDEYRRRYVALRTLPIKLISEEKEIEIIALLDECSTSTYINESVVAEMNLRGFPFKSTVNMLDGHQANINSMVVPITVSGLDGKYQQSDYAEVTKDVAANLDIVDWEKYKRLWPHLKDIPFYPVSHSAKVDILLGVNFLDVIRSVKDVSGKVGEPIARLTPLGWTCAGAPVPVFSQEATTRVNFTYMSIQNMSVHELLSKFWEWEDPPQASPLTKEEQHAEQVVESTIRKTKDGYMVSIPWLDGQPTVPDNYDEAYKRLVSTEKRLLKQKDNGKAYDKALMEQVANDYMRLVKTGRALEGKVWYLPHFPIFRLEHSTTPCRPVYDSSVEFMGISIAQFELTGPKYQQDIIVVITRFRHYPVGIGCDIAQMYQRIWVFPIERSYQRILWRNLDQTREPDIYEHTRVTFGRKSSPYLALKVSQMNAKEHQEQYPRAAETILESTYMDDSFDSVLTEEEGIQLYKDLKTVWGGANMEPKKWLTNSKALLEQIPKEERASKFDFIDKDMPSDKTLGLLLYPEEDFFSFKTREVLETTIYTKRVFLKTIAVIYDPVGFVTPITIRGKVYFQEMWSRGLDWDEELQEDLHELVSAWVRQLIGLKDIKIQRALVVKAEFEFSAIHCFCDASEYVYGAVCYIVTYYTDGSVSSNILGSKAKVAPLKTVSIPRLELEASVVGTKLTKKFSTTLDIKQENIHYWVDSTDVMYWVRSRGRNYKPYVNNRIGFIQQESDTKQWKHVGTRDNIADLLSRGAKVSELTEEHAWFKGPTFITGSKDQWPKQERFTETEEGLKEKKTNYKFVFTCIAAVEDTGKKQTNTRSYMNIDKFVEKCSKWEKMVRVICYIRRFIEACRKDNQTRVVTITGMEFQYGAYTLIQSAQVQEWKEEISALKRFRELKTSSPLKAFNPFLDDNGLIRSNTRLEYSESLAWDTKYPIVLPRQSHVSRKIIMFEHEKNGHASASFTLSQLRILYAMISFRETVRNVVKDCAKCKLYVTKVACQQMAPLPKERVTEGYRAFEVSSVDYAGPYYIRRGRGMAQDKRWLCLFCCQKTRAVHLEIATSLNTDAFLLAFYRFTIRRGVPIEVLSDNGTNFVAGCKELGIEVSFYDMDSVQAGTASAGVTWKFLPSGAPHMGGLHEALVKTMKRALNKVLGKADVYEDELKTAVIMVEGLMNSRPLTYVSGDVGELLPLTPNHFLMGTYRIFVENDGRVSEHESMIRRWRRVQDLVKLAWQRWMRELLPELGCRPKWFKTFTNLSEGDVVLVIDAENDRGCWPLGRVEKVYPGRDGLVRTVDVRIGGKIFRRPIVRLVPIVQNDK